MEPEPIGGAWHRLLIELEFAQNYPLASSISALGRTVRNPVLDDLLPSLIQIKAVAILDAALKTILTQRRLVVPKKRYAQGLKGRIDFLSDQGLLAEANTLNQIRNSRNDVAHEFEQRIGWEQLHRDVAAIHACLQLQGFVPPRPTFESFAERSEARSSDDPRVSFAFDYRVGIRDSTGKTVADITWTENIMRNGE